MLIKFSLLQWIKTKKVTKCELCKYPFKLSKGTASLRIVLTSVYDPQMPSRVPHRLFLRRLILQLRNNMLIYLRFLLVCFIWLGLVPFVARWIWRFYFRFGDWSSVVTLSSTNTTVTPATNETAEVVPEPEKSGLLENGFFGWLKGQDLWTAILRDCFQGQIITICLVVVFVVVFLIREWVMQNAVAVNEQGPADDGIPAVRLAPEEEQLLFQPAEAALPDEPVANIVHADTPPAEMQDDPFQDEHLFPEWVRQRRDHLADPFARPMPQAQDIEAVLARQQAEQQQRNPPPFPAVIPQQNIPQVDFPVVNDLNNRRGNEAFEEDELDGDDFDGLWDILGMQGPIIGLLHNTVFSALMIALAVGLGVWLPFMFGKTALGALVRFRFFGFS
jgi:E3 ubiquitin-protein ligase DOA10